MSEINEAALNEAIAKYEGYVNIIQVDGKLIGTDTKRYAKTATIRETIPDYTQSLDAIVPVVKRWCGGHRDRFFNMSYYDYRTECEACIFDENWDDEKMLAHKGIAKTLSLALCLAFVKAAGIEWEK